MEPGSFESRVDPELLPGLEVFHRLDHASAQFAGESLEHMRTAMVAVLADLRGDEPHDPTVARADRELVGPDGDPLRVRVYRPAAGVDEDRPGILWLHGGGYVMGTLDMDDGGCEGLVADLGAVVVSVDYRLAPEHPHPAPVHDAHAALTWMADHASELGIDPSRIAVAGGSAGGGLAAATCLLARDRGGPAISQQVLLYPMLDDRNDTPSVEAFPDIPPWNSRHNAAAWSALLGTRADGDDTSPCAAPARAVDVSGLPPTFLQVGELDIFRDEDIEYARRLMQAGVSTELHVYPGVYHAAEGFAPEAAVARQMTQDRLRALRAGLA